MENARPRSDAARTGRITLGSLMLLCAIVACLITGRSLSQVSSGGDGAANESVAASPAADATPAAAAAEPASITDLFLIERDPYPEGEIRSAGRVLLRDAETGDVLRPLSGFRPMDGFGGSALLIEHAGGASLAVSAMWARGSGRVYLYDVVDTLAQGPEAAPYLQIAGRGGEIFGAGLYTPDAVEIEELAGRAEVVAVDVASLERRPLLGVYSVFSAGYGDGYVRRSLHDVETGEALLVESDESAMARGAALLGADLNRDGEVDAGDLAELLGQWGRMCAAEEAGACGVREDLNGDGVVNAQDLAILLANWGREAVGFPDLGGDGEWTPRSAPCCVDLNCCHPHSCGCSGCPEMCGGGLPGCEPTSVTPCENEIPCAGEGCDDGGDGGDGGPEPPCEDCPEPPCPDCPDLCPDPPCEDPCPEPPCKNGANCIVEIIGCPDPAYLCLVNDGLPRELNLAAAGGPSGGEYKWSVTGATIAIDPITGLPADSDQWVTILGASE